MNIDIRYQYQDLLVCIDGWLPWVLWLKLGKGVNIGYWCGYCILILWTRFDSNVGYSQWKFIMDIDIEIRNGYLTLGIDIDIGILRYWISILISFIAMRLIMSLHIDQDVGSRYWYRHRYAIGCCYYYGILFLVLDTGCQCGDWILHIYRLVGVRISHCKNTDTQKHVHPF